MRKQRGSRANRTGLTRSGQRALAGLLLEPLPDDRGERYVEEARRAWLRAAWSDQRLPANKKNAERKHAAFELAAENHLTRDHGVTITRKRDLWLTMYIDGDPVHSLSRYHYNTFHKED